ncbi:uncharacterized protein LOC104581828 isoform X1 [Brachypodium distachyon]|nr:uncharacterized protein LOC104581828 isoform X1 [Brachypodium distachyon]|eukprot:XP_010228890.1 uncharacterized protein LOC104581828 isoform X1 [Brachypodium distachyon]
MAPSWVLLPPELPFTHDAGLFSEASQQSKGWMSEGRPPRPEETRGAITAYLESLKPDAHFADPPEISYIRLLRPTESVPPLCGVVDSAWISSIDKHLFALYAGQYRPGSDICARNGGYLIYDARKNSLSPIPEIPYHMSQSAIGYETAVVVSFDGDGAGEGAGYVLAELTKKERLKEGSEAELFLWQSSSPGWVSKIAVLPPEVCSPTTDFCADKCFSFGGFLCWVDLSKGMLVCELCNLQEDNDLKFRYIALPDNCPTYDLFSPENQTLQVQEFRSIGCVGGQIKFVSVDDQVGHLPGHKLEMNTWTLSSDLTEWKDGKMYNLGKIWENGTHLLHGMRKLAPSLPFLSKHEDNVVYVVFNDMRVVGSHLECKGQYLVRIDMKNDDVKFYRQTTYRILSQLFTCEIGADQQGLLEDQQEGDPPKVKVEFGGEPQENNPAKLTAMGLAISMPPASRFNEKRRPGDGDDQTCNAAALRKTKI